MAGFLLHKTDKGTFGNTFRVVLAENEDALAAIGWPSNAEDMGFATGDNTVTITRMTGGDVMPSVTGATPERMMPYLADGVAKETGWEIAFTVGGLTHGTLRPVLVLSPILAETIAKAGWTKDDVKRYLYDHARMPAWRVEEMTERWTEFKIGSLKHQYNIGKLSKDFAESDDPGPAGADRRSIRTISWCWSRAIPCAPTPMPSPTTAISAFRWPRRSSCRRIGRPELEADRTWPGSNLPKKNWPPCAASSSSSRSGKSSRSIRS